MIARTDMSVMVTVTFNDNQLGAHLRPLTALEAVSEIVLVTDRPPGIHLDKVRVVVPARLVTALAGRALAKTITCAITARRSRPEWVIGFNLVPHGLNAYVAARGSGARVLYHQIGGPREWLGGGWDSDNNILGRLRRPNVRLERFLLAVVRRCDFVAVMGERGGSCIVARGVAPGRVAIIPGSVENPIGPPPPKRFDFISVGELIPVKRTRDFLTALGTLRSEGATFRAAIVGDGPLRSSLEKYSDDLGLSECVTFLGFRSDVHELCRSSRVFAMTSEYEGLSIALLDAMAASLAVVGSDVGEIRSVVEDGVSGWIYPSADVSALTEALRVLLHDETLRSRLGRAARSSAISHASVQEVSARLATILESDPPPVLPVRSRRRALRGRLGQGWRV